MGKPIIYVAHPVSGDVKANCDKVLRWLRWLTEVDPSRIYIAPWVGEVLAHLDLDRIPADFYDTLAGIAGIAAAVGGYGGFDASQTPLSPDKTLAALLVHPETRDQWFDVHIVSATALAGSAAGRAWANDFERFERRGLVFFLQKTYLELCRTFGETE